MLTQPLVSILINCFNGEKYLREAAELRLLNTNLSATERERVFALARGELD